MPSASGPLPRVLEGGGRYSRPPGVGGFACSVPGSLTGARRYLVLGGDSVRRNGLLSSAMLSASGPAPRQVSPSQRDVAVEDYLQCRALLVFYPHMRGVALPSWGWPKQWVRSKPTLLFPALPTEVALFLSQGWRDDASLPGCRLPRVALPVQRPETPRQAHSHYALTWGSALQPAPVRAARASAQC